MRRVLHNRPWLLVVAAFLLLIAAWAALIAISQRNPVEPIPVEPVRRS